METDFTPLTSLLGGALIGISAVILLASHGRIAGISGIVSCLLPPSIDRPWLMQGIIFLAGLLFAAPLWTVASGAVPLQLVFRKCAPNDYCRPSGWIRFCLGEWLHKWARGMRHLTWFSTVNRSHRYLYGYRLWDCIYSSPYIGRLSL